MQIGCGTSEQVQLYATGSQQTPTHPFLTYDMSMNTFCDVADSKPCECDILLDLLMLESQAF